jgi:hypothetical protein
MNRERTLLTEFAGPQEIRDALAARQPFCEKFTGIVSCPAFGAGNIDLAE